MDMYLSASLLSNPHPQTYPVSITAPLVDTVFTAGGLAVVTWTEPRSPTISQITLLKGPLDKPQPIIQVATDVDTDDGKFSWSIPEDFPAGPNYAFELGTAPNSTYTSLFAIKSMNDRSSFINTSYGVSAANSLAPATFQLPITTLKAIAVAASIAAGAALLLTLSGDKTLKTVSRTAMRTISLPQHPSIFQSPLTCLLSV